jgi:DNA-binding response OmpR family regulator
MLRTSKYKRNLDKFFVAGNLCRKLPGGQYGIIRMDLGGRNLKQQMAKLLLIEDDVNLAQMIVESLRREHHSIEVTHDGRDGFELLVCSEFDLAIIDWNLPGLEGPEIVQKYRTSKGSAPIIMLTGRGSIGEKATGFDAGADDYLTKPFNVEELSLRVKALLRRGRHVDEDVLSVHGIVLDPAKYSAKKNGVDLALLPREFALLEFLMRNPDVFFTGEALFRHVWRSDSEASDSAIRTCIKRLRQKIDDENSPSIIETVPRIGYRLRK